MYARFFLATSSSSATSTRGRLLLVIRCSLVPGKGEKIINVRDADGVFSCGRVDLAEQPHFLFGDLQNVGGHIRRRDLLEQFVYEGFPFFIVRFLK